MAQLLDGRAAVRLDLPSGWTRTTAAADAEGWSGPGGVTLQAELRRAPLLVDPFLIDDHRQDLRLCAAERGGGLVECEPVLGGSGVAGLLKLPRAPGAAAVRIEGHALLPLAEGHLALRLTAEEEEPGGSREAVLRRELPAEGWVADPYGRPYERKARDRDFTRYQPPPSLLLRTRADDAAHDARFPAHPLSRVRSALRQLLERLQLLRPSLLEVESDTAEVHGVQLGLPLGFLPEEAPSPPRGRQFRRWSFGGRAVGLRVELLPDAEPAARVPAEAARLLVARAGQAVSQGPRCLERTVGRYRGVYAEAELGAGPVRYAVAFLVPWRAGEALLLQLEAPQDDWARANRDLEAVVCCLSPWEDPRPADADESSDETAKFAHVSLNGLRRVYRVLCRLAHCDGDVHPRERTLLETFCRRHRIPAIEAAALEAESAASERLRVGRKPAERELLIHTMLDLVAADGVLDPAEQTRLLRIARAVELPESELAARIEERLR